MVVYCEIRGKMAVVFIAQNRPFKPSCWLKYCLEWGKKGD